MLLFIQHVKREKVNAHTNLPNNMSQKQTVSLSSMQAELNDCFIYTSIVLDCAVA